MKKCIVYGVGQRYNYLKPYIDNEFDIIAYADKNPSANKGLKIIPPSAILNLNYDCIYITSDKYADEITAELTGLGIPKEKILSERDMWWYIPNADVRHEWIRKQLAMLPPGTSILDAGAGNRRYQKYCSHLNYVSQDFGEYDNVEKSVGIHGKEAWKSKECNIVSDIINIPVENESFDAIMCTEVFEHIKNPVLALKEFTRILSRGGVLLLTAPFCSPTHMAPYYYQNGFSRYWYEEHLKVFGFEIQEIKSFGNYFSYIAQELERMYSMAGRYAAAFDKESSLLCIELTKKLMELSKGDKNSSEVLCFGFLVKAVKK